MNYVVRNCNVTEDGNHHVYGRIVKVLKDYGWQQQPSGHIARQLLCLIETEE